MLKHSKGFLLLHMNKILESNIVESYLFEKSEKHIFSIYRKYNPHGKELYIIYGILHVIGSFCVS